MEEAQDLEECQEESPKARWKIYLEGFARVLERKMLE